MHIEYENSTRRIRRYAEFIYGTVQKTQQFYVFELKP